MIAPRLPLGPRVLVVANPALVAEAVFVAPGQISVRSVEDVADRIVAIEQTVTDTGFVVRHPVPDLELHHLAVTAGLIEFEGAGERIRRLLIVIEHEVAADGRHTIRKPDAESPARDIDLVDPLIAEVSVSGVPDPVPVVVKAIAGERPGRRRARPEVVVDSMRHRFRRRSSDRFTTLEAQASRQIDVAKGAFVQVVNGLDLRASGAALRAVLDDPLVLLRRAHELAPFPQVV